MPENLGFLISDVSRLMRRRFDQRARTIAATRAQWRALTVLKRHQGINQGGLADLLEVEPITACRMIDRLEESGLVERRRDPADRRIWRIYLTDAAWPVIDQLRALADEMIEAALDGIEEPDRERLIALLSRIQGNLNDHDNESERAHG